MKVISLKIRNILGIKELDINPGDITIIEGRNGSGKTSALEAIQNLIGGGSIMRIRNVDACEDEKSEIVLSLNGEEGSIIAKKDEKGISVKKQIGDTAAFIDVKRPSTFIQDLFDSKLSNPMRFLDCNNKERVQLLFEALPLKFERSDFFKTIGVRDSKSVPDGLHPIVEIAMHRDVIFRERTGVNRDEKTKRQTCDQMRRSVPAEIPSVEDLDSLTKKRDKIRIEHIKKIDKLKAAAASDRNRIKSGLREKKASADSEIEIFSEKIMREAEKRITSKREEIHAQLSVDRVEAETALETVETALNTILDLEKSTADDLETMSSKIATMKERSKEAERVRERQDIANRFEKEADDLLATSSLLTKALERLDDYKASMCADLPIPGLDVLNNVVSVYGVPWEQLNTAQRIQIAVKVACLRLHGEKFRPIFIDGAEALDEDSLIVLENELKENNAQAFITKVLNKDLRISVK